MKKFTVVDEITYHGYRQTITKATTLHTKNLAKEKESSSETKYDSFGVGERKKKVIISGRQTIVILDDGSKGISICGRKDTFNGHTGIAIASLRAEIASKEKKLAKLIEG